jgi:hypothetical protein
MKTGRRKICREVLLAWLILLGTALPALLPATSAMADINPWIAASLYDPGKWDTGGPYTGTPWMHPPQWSPGPDRQLGRPPR